MYQYQHQIKMHDIDAAGVLFFARQFYLMHDAYESFLSENNFSIASILKNQNFIIPIVHAEADFKSAVFAGEKLTVQLSAEKISDSSFTLGYSVFTSEQKKGFGKTIHVVVNKNTQKKESIPEELKAILQKLQS